MRSKRNHSSRDRLVVGIHSSREVLKVRPDDVTQIWLRQKYQDNKDLLEIADLAEKRGLKIMEKSSQELDKKAQSHQGVAVFVSSQPEVDWNQLKQDGTSCVLVLDGLEDPHNFGAIIRTAWLLGVDAIFAPEDRAVGLSPVTCKVASGGAEHIPVEFTGQLHQTLDELKELGYWVFGLAGGAKMTMFQQEFPEKTALVVGSEAKGMRAPVEKKCDEIIEIPQRQAQASYNASVAAAMVLTEVYRQQIKE